MFDLCLAFGHEWKLWIQGEDNLPEHCHSSFTLREARTNLRMLWLFSSSVLLHFPSSPFSTLLAILRNLLFWPSCLWVKSSFLDIDRYLPSSFKTSSASSGPSFSRKLILAPAFKIFARLCLKRFLPTFLQPSSCLSSMDWPEVVGLARGELSQPRPALKEERRGKDIGPCHDFTDSHLWYSWGSTFTVSSSELWESFTAFWGWYGEIQNLKGRNIIH